MATVAAAAIESLALAAVLIEPLVLAEVAVSAKLVLRLLLSPTDGREVDEVVVDGGAGDSS